MSFEKSGKTMKDDSKTVPARTDRWSEESRRSVCIEWTTGYRDIHYQCWHCKAAAVFTAAQQKHTFEVKKAHISQRRSLCEACWKESNRIAKELDQYAVRWAAEKASLRTNVAFLEAWQLLLSSARNYSWRHDVARQRMVERLLTRCR
jgi:hypothetical protein